MASARQRAAIGRLGYQDFKSAFDRYGTAKMFGVNNIGGRWAKAGLLEMDAKAAGQAIWAGTKNWWGGNIGGSMVREAAWARRGAVGLLAGGMAAGAIYRHNRRRY